MAQTVMTPPEQEEHTSGQRGPGWVPNLGPDPVVEGGNPFTSFWNNIRDTFFPEKLPPLQLESKPIPVVDRMAVKRDPKSTAVAVVVHVLLLLLIFFIGRKVVQTIVPKKTNVTLVDPNVAPPVKLPPAATQRGGGGGQHDLGPVTKGSLPPPSKVQITPPKIRIDHPALPVEPTLVMQPMKMQQTLPNFGDPSAPKVGVASMGNGHGTGIGSGNGAGRGPGEGGNEGGGVYRVGEGGVSAPVVIRQVDPEFSEEARKAKYQGTVLVNMVVDTNGRPTRIKVLRPLGMGLDEKAIEAASKYLFKPARKNGQPVPVEINVEVVFQIF